MTAAEIEDNQPGAAPDHTARVLTTATIILAATVIAGWVLDIAALKTIVPGFSSMKMNTAIALVLTCVSLRLQIGPVQGGGRRRIARGLALVVLVIGAMSLAEWVFGADLRIDQLVCRDSASGAGVAGRMGPNTAIAFVLEALALVTLDHGKLAGTRYLGDVTTVGVILLGYLALIGYAYSVTTIYGVGWATQMAIHTVIAHLAIAVSLVAARPDRGLGAIVTQRTSAGATLRRLLPVVVILPPVIGWLQLQGQSAGWYGTELGLSLTASGYAGALASVVLWNADVQGRVERVHGDLAADDRFLAALTEVIYTTNGPDHIFDQVSARLGVHLGLARCYFADIDVANDRCVVARDFHRGVSSAAGEYQVSSFNSNVANMRRGISVVNNDTRLDPRSHSKFTPTFRPMAMLAYISMPHVRDGEWVGSLVASVAQPRVWRDHEIAVLRAVSERTWLWVEHLRIVAALRDSETRQGALLGELRAINADLESRVRARTAELSGTLREREVMLQEIHHRVKNNLQVISSLINMQVRRLDPGATRDALDECQTRVLAIALIHEKLYQSKDYSHVQFAEYARSLASNVFHASGISQQHVALELAIQDVPLGIDRAIPCGLVINELISNALKHGFKHGRAGTIRVALTALEGALQLTVSDDGAGLPAGFDIHALASMGLQLVCTLAEQLEATLVVDGSHGASFQLTFAVSS